MISPDALLNAFSIGTKQEKDTYKYSTVKKVNANGTVEVELAPGLKPEERTVCNCLYSASVNDRVQVCIKANGTVVVLGKIGRVQ